MRNGSHAKKRRAADYHAYRGHANRHALQPPFSRQQGNCGQRNRNLNEGGRLRPPMMLMQEGLARSVVFLDIFL